MHFKLKTDYCIRVLIYLQDTQRQWTVQQIADNLQVSKNHLSVVIHALSDLGLIDSTQGPRGGVKINPHAAESSLADLVIHIEKIKIVECFDQENISCTLLNKCKSKLIFANAQKAFIKELQQYKIKDLL